jgi:hypothetical protein
LWLPAKELTYAKDVLCKFKSKHTSKEGIQVLQVQGGLKEGILLRAMPTPSQIQTNSPTSPKKPPLNLSYSQVVKTNHWARDPGKCQVIKSPDPSCDLSVSQVSRDQSAHDRRKPLGDLPRDWSPI